MALETRNKLPKLICSILIFLWMCVTVAFNVHSICLNQCSNQTISGKSSYQGCMRDCFSKHNENWLMKRGGACGLVDHYQPDSSPVCSAEDIEVISKTQLISDDFDKRGSNREFLVILWSPCPYGIYDVKGYEVTLFETEVAGFSLCKRTVLMKELQAENLNETFSLVFDEHYLDYSANYEIWVEGLPKTSRRHHALINYLSLSCPELNGYGSCECGLSGFKMLPVPKVIVTGYTVLVNLTFLNDCFGIHRYMLSLLVSANSTISLLQTENITPHTNVKYVLHKFDRVYPANGKLLVQYRAFSEYGKSRSSDSVTFDIEDYKPFVISVYSEGNTVSVVWKCAEYIYNVTKYEVKLSRHVFNSASIVSGIMYDVPTKCIAGQNLTMEKSFIVFRTGTYSAQVRGYRDDSPYFQSPIWSDVTDQAYVQIHSQVINSEDAKAAALTMFSIVVIAIVAVSCLYCLKKGYCTKIRHRLPISMDVLFSSPTFNHRSKSVWIIWQADQRGGVYRQVHCENIRHLASYFSNRCGLNIILDQYDHLSLTNLSTWITQKTKEAEVVLFICPHFALTDYNTSLQPEAIGNFLAPFRFYENALWKDLRSPQFITAALPYTGENLCPVVELLLQTTPVFQLMDQMEDLYFFIQGRPKVNRLGRYLLQNISGKEYLKTPEGKALESGIKKMILLQSHDLSISEDSELNIPSAVTETEQLLIEGESVKPVVASTEDNLLGTASDFRPNPPPAVIDEEDAESSLFLIETQDLLSVKYLAENSLTMG